MAILAARGYVLRQLEAFADWPTLQADSYSSDDTYARFRSSVRFLQPVRTVHRTVFPEVPLDNPLPAEDRPACCEKILAHSAARYLAFWPPELVDLLWHSVPQKIATAQHHVQVRFLVV